jgi:enoyl-[acyl-carrier protein] reductase III
MGTADRFKGKIALVTGSSRGIGKIIALKLAAEGADVAIHYYRKKSAAQKTAEQAAAFGVQALTVRADLGDAEKIPDLFAEIRDRFGRLDILISNAATGIARPAMELSDRNFSWVMDVNARAFLLCAQQAAPLMEEGGKMVAISSLGSRLVMPVYTAVGVSKAALEALTRYLAVELAPRGIRVNAIAAGAVESEALALYTANPDLPTASWQNTPAGRMVLPEDIAELTAFLASDAAEMIRGQTIVLDGGMSLTNLPPPQGNGASSGGGGTQKNNH